MRRPPGLSVLIGRLQAEIAKAPVAKIEDGAVGASIGAAWFPTEGDTVDALLAAADHAMYEAKQSHRTWATQRPGSVGNGAAASAVSRDIV
jgi:predicted signal transduction protein with EAL and GGDEF domain